MIKWYNENDYNLQLRFLVSLRSSEGDRKCHEFLFLFFFSETEDIVTLYDDKSYQRLFIHFIYFHTFSVKKFVLV